MKAGQLGFTLIEVSVVVAILVVVAGFSFQTYKIAQSKDQVSLASNSVVTAMRRAMVQARGVAGDSAWGVKIDNNKIIVFQGDSYAARDNDLDEVLSTPGWLTYSGLDEVVFSKLAALPNTTGTITISGPNGAEQTLTLNSYGAVTY